MKIYNLPDEVPFNEDGLDWMADDYLKQVERREKAHREALEQWARTHGYDNKNTGKMYREPAADGYAQYMLVEPTPGTGLASALIHLPYGDAWHGSAAPHMSKKAVLDAIARDEAIAELFSQKAEA